jgi:hypothetical protein
MGFSAMISGEDEPARRPSATDPDVPHVSIPSKNIGFQFRGFPVQNSARKGRAINSMT